MSETNYYKSWSGLKKQLTDNLCDALRGRITFFLTRYHDVHNSYGRASIRLDGKELIIFSWVDMYKQEFDFNEMRKITGACDYDNSDFKEKWDNEATFSDCDFLAAATEYLQLSIKKALESENYLIKVFAIMDRRVGKRTLEKVRNADLYKDYPDWVQQFYRLRMENDK